MMKYGWLVVMVLWWAEATEAQHVQRVGAEVQYGFIIPHASDLKAFSDRRPAALHLSWQMMNTGKERWEVCNCFHYLGARFSITDFGDAEVLGRAYTLAGTFEPLLWRTQDLSLNLPAGTGVTYLSRVYDEKDNPENRFFSSPLSFLLFVAPTLEMRFSSSFSGNISFNYNHISNGGQKKPNRGMNFPQVGLGVNYVFRDQPLPDYEKQKPAKGWWYWIEAGITRRNVAQRTQQKPWVSVVAGAGRIVTAINGLSLGIEAGRDYSLQKDDGSFGKTISAPFVGHHFRLGRVDFSQRMALYIHRPEELSAHTFYQRYQLFVEVGKGWQAGVSLTAHAHVARNLDLRVGYVF
jgi:hypothetical protein